ncbi:hypothetical protein K1719_033553 [Acacia pycnantha]|nr:hypothetical protein K1719_033553 [Acacia pycnantha]
MSQKRRPEDGEAKSGSSSPEDKRRKVQLEPTSSWASLPKQLYVPSKYTGIVQASKDIFREEGIKIFDIIGFIYEYLKLLRQIPPQEWIFEELQNIGNMEFRFAEEQPQDDYAAELAGLDKQWN